MKLYDVTVPVFEGMPTWPKDPGVSISLSRSIRRGDEANVTQLQMGAHTGTHTDAPIHFEPNGYGIDQIPLDVLIGPCRVFDLCGIAGQIDAAAVAKCDLQGVTRALFKTQNSEHWARGDRDFDPHYRGIVEDGAKLLVQRGIRLVGVDYLSVEPYGSKQHPVHHTLLGASIAIIEGLDLSQVPEGDYEIMALPMKLRGADGAPTRVVLRG